MDFLKNPAKLQMIFLKGFVSQISKWIMIPLCPPKTWGMLKKFFLILEQFSTKFLDLFYLSNIGVGSNPTSESLVLVPTYYEQFVMFVLFPDSVWNQNCLEVSNSNAPDVRQNP